MEYNKYPENYFEHYIVSFSTTNQTLDKTGFENLARLYIDIEGSESFSELIKEIQIINDNDDWSYFEEIARDFEITDMSTYKLKEIAEVAFKVYMDMT